MGNKGFAITGIIYTLFILFLMILVTVITGLSSLQKMMINSTEKFETAFEGKEIDSNELTTINTTGTAPYTGKYLFRVTNNMGVTINDCVAYLAKDTNLNDEQLILSPAECNIDISKKELMAVYSLEES